MEREENENQNRPQLAVVKQPTANGQLIELGSVGIHSRAAECLYFADVHRAIRRHEAGEIQPDLTQGLVDLATSESAATGLVISYHVASNAFVFGVVTNRIAEKTFVELAPLASLERFISWPTDASFEEQYV